MSVVLTTMLLAVLAAAPINVKGKWEGTITGTRDDGTASTDSTLLILEQKDATITGTIGGSETDQHKITKGTIDGDKLVLVATRLNGRDYRLELTVKGDEMNGTIAAGTLKATVAVKRRKD